MVHGVQRFLALVAVGLALAACGPTVSTSPRPVASPQAEPSRTVTMAEPTGFSRAVFDVGLRRIADVYVEPVAFGPVVLDGLNGFSEIDTAVQFERVSDQIVMTVGDVPVARASGIGDRDPGAWADAVSLLLAEAQRRSAPLADTDAEALYEAFFDALIADLDPYSRYVNAERARAERAYRDGYGGVGLLIETEEDGRHMIREVFPTGPAARVGVVADSEILAIDGDSTEPLDLAAVGDRIRGPVGSRVALSVLPPDGVQRTVQVVREQVIPDTVAVSYAGRVAILEVSRFNAGTTDDLIDALGEVESRLGLPTGLVLDLRGNPGGLLDQSVDVADLFIDRGEIIHTRGRHRDSGQEFRARIRDRMVGVPMVVLLDGRSASGAEVVAGALQDVGRAVVVGASSFGKGSVQTVTRLPNDGELFLTWSRIFVPSGYSFHEQGVLPSICTSTGIGNAAAVVEAFRSGRLEAPAELHSVREVAHVDESARQILRAACPWREHDAQLDVDVALALLDDPGLYSQALAAAIVAPGMAQR